MTEQRHQSASRPSLTYKKKISFGEVCLCFLFETPLLFVRVVEFCDLLADGPFEFVLDGLKDIAALMLLYISSSYFSSFVA
jgi:hypothetical protein